MKSVIGVKCPHCGKTISAKEVIGTTLYRIRNHTTRNTVAFGINNKVYYSFCPGSGSTVKG